jgi:hypothetical protein
MDSDGYGYRPDEHGIAGLLEDLRTLSPAGIERVAHGWERHAQPHLDRYHEAESAALHAIETAHATSEWEATQREILDLTEGRTSLISWKVEHGQKGHNAESAALGAALALQAAGHLDSAHVATLTRPMSEALPWLATEGAGEPG